MFRVAILFLAVVAQAASALDIQVFTASEDSFHVTSTLITGREDAILVDAQFTLSEAKRLTAMIKESRKNLTTIYITHSHPDHYFGLEVVKAAYPRARVVALAGTVAAIKESWEGKLAYWKPILGRDLTDKPLIPEVLKDDSLVLDGKTIELIGELQGDEKDNSIVYVRALNAVICGDVVYAGVFPWTLETTPDERLEWIKSVEKIERMRPAIVVAGHKKPRSTDTPDSLTFTKAYLRHYDWALKRSKTGAEFKKEMRESFPGVTVVKILDAATEQLFPAKSSTR